MQEDDHRPTLEDFVRSPLFNSADDEIIFQFFRDMTRQGVDYQDIEKALIPLLRKNFAERIETIREKLDLPDST